MLRLQTYLQDLRSAQARNAHVGHAGAGFPCCIALPRYFRDRVGTALSPGVVRKGTASLSAAAGEDSLLNIQIGCQQPRVRFVDYVGYGYVQRGGSANRSPLDIGYCVKFSEAVHAELVRHRDVVGDRLEFYLLLNKMRWYLVYLRKSHNPWAGDTEFARGINAEAERYRAELEGFFSRCDWLLLRMDRRRWMRPGCSPSRP